MSASQQENSGRPGKRFLGRFDPRFARLVQPLLYGLLITVCLFAAYEVVERIWLTHLEMHTLHLLHMLRGIFSSVIVAGFVGWMIIRTSPGFLPMAASADEAWVQSPRPTETERTKAYAAWFIAMRWIAVMLAGLLVFMSVQVVHWLPQEVWVPLVSTVVALAALNVLYLVLLRRERGLFAVLLLQGYFDLLILTTLLHFSGGIENPLSMMMIFHVIIGGILLSRRHCYWMAAAGSLLFAILAAAEWGDVVEHYTLQIFPHFEQAGGELFHPAHHTLYACSRVLLQAVVLFLTAYFVTTLAERLRENERRLETMAGRALAGQQLLEQSLQTTGTGLRVLGRNAQVFWANTRWKEWFECPPGRACTAPEPLNGANSPARQTLGDGRTRVTEIVLQKGGCLSELAGANDGERVFQVTTAPLRDVSGDIQQIVELAQDITQQKQAQAQMMRAGRLAAVGELAGQVAHEVNNPIAIVIAKIHLLLSDYGKAVPTEVGGELAKIAELTGRVARIAQGLLSYCRPSAAARLTLDVRDPIRKSLALIEQPARMGGVQIEDRMPDQLPSIKANGPELEQVFLNLFLNALDAMPHGGRLTVDASASSARLSQGQGALEVTVADTGPGISEGMRERIFEPFFTTKQEGRGTGLGLSICHGLVRSHGGEIIVESEPGRGARFIVRLPIETVSADKTAYA